jgi:alkyl hydroperoxide reductase subunit AhpF
MATVASDLEIVSIRRYLEGRLLRDVSIDQFGPALPRLHQLSDKLHVREHPAKGAEAGMTVLSGAAKGRVRFIGMPWGYELVPFLNGLCDVARGDTNLQERTKRALAQISTDIHIEVFVSPRCPYGPALARMAHKMAIESNRITADVIDIHEARQLVEHYGIRATPTVAIQGRVAFVGDRSEDELLEHVVRAADLHADSGGASR